MRAVQHPPAVQYPAQPGRAPGWFCALLWLGTLALLLAWRVAQPQLAGFALGVWILALGALCPLGWALWRWERGLHRGWLAHHAQQWSLHASDAAQAAQTLDALEVVWDAQSALLLRGVPGHGAAARWCWLRRASATPAQWHALRCAVHAQRKAQDQSPV